VAALTPDPLCVLRVRLNTRLGQAEERAALWEKIAALAKNHAAMADQEVHGAEERAKLKQRVCFCAGIAL
jgi:hypothetical protein